MDLDNPDQFPEKIKQLNEETKWAQEKIKDLNAKREAETEHLNKQNNLIEMVSRQINDVKAEIENQNLEQMGTMAEQDRKVFSQI